MKKLILTLAIALMGSFAQAQTVEVTRQHEMTRTHSRPRVESRERAEARPEPRQMTEERSEHQFGADTRLTFRNRDTGFLRSHGPVFWRDRVRHDRGWYITTFGEPNLRLINGCWYYRYGDCFWPAFGYDPDCVYPNGDAPICD